MSSNCAFCDRRHRQLPPIPSDRYAYLLGMYLGDGCISEQQRGVTRLRVTLDARYPGIINECADALEVTAVFNVSHVQPKSGERSVEVGASSKAWPCLFPQHGRGPKHLRPIALAPWQQAVAAQQPGLLLRGLLHSDGCRVINRITASGRTYSYPRYMFTNASVDIQRIFCEACDALGIAWTQMRERALSVARRDSVAALDRFVGPKSLAAESAALVYADTAPPLALSRWAASPHGWPRSLRRRSPRSTRGRARRPPRA